MRWEVPSAGLLLFAPAYTLTQRNVVTSDPRTPAVRMQMGEGESSGSEFEAKGRPGKHLELIASYAYTDARTTRSLRPEDIGLRYLGTRPRCGATHRFAASAGQAHTPGWMRATWAR